MIFRNEFIIKIEQFDILEKMFTWKENKHFSHYFVLLLDIR